MVLQRAGDDLGRRGGAAIDQHDERLVLGEVARARVEALRLLGIAAARRDDLAPLEERVGDRDRLVEQAARIVAQIDHVALELLVRDLVGDVADRLLEAVGGLLVELGDADDADVVALDARAHRAHADDVAHDRHFDRLLDALARDLEADLGVDLAAHLLDRLIEREALHRLVVEMRDDVARAHARLGGRRVVDRGDDLHQAFLHGDLDAEAAELAARLHLHVAEALRVHVARMRLDQLAVVRLLDIVRAHALEDVAEQIELAIGVDGGRGARARPDGNHRRLGDKDGQRGPRRRTENNQGSLAHHPRTFSLSVIAHHGFGSTGDPSLRNST